MNSPWFQRLSLMACCLAFIVIVLGAYVRLSDAGLGCPDWPGCFGQITAPDDAREISRARMHYPDTDIDSAKAWKEMLHRYLASLLGLLIIAMAVLAWRNRREPGQAVSLPFFLVALVIFQGMLGMWTVTQLLRPTIVTLHLLTGLVTLSGLFWVYLQHRKPPQAQNAQGSKSPPKATDLTGRLIPRLAKLAVLVLALQIFLGGWTSTNYVALYCPDFPTCQGQWIPQTNFKDAFVFFKDPSINYEGGTLPLDAGVTVHFMHRVGAVLATIVILGLATLILVTQQVKSLKRVSAVLFILVTLQVSLGVANVLLVLPIAIAVAHNAIAAALLLVLLMLNYSLGSDTGSAEPAPS